MVKKWMKILSYLRKIQRPDAYRGRNQYSTKYTRKTQLVCRIFKDDKSIGGCCSSGCGRDRASFTSTNDKKSRETNTSSKKNQTKNQQ